METRTCFIIALLLSVWCLFAENDTSFVINGNVVVDTVTAVDDSIVFINDVTFKGDEFIEGRLHVKSGGLASRKYNPPLKVSADLDARYLALDKNGISAFRDTLFSDLFINSGSSAYTYFHDGSSGGVAIGTRNIQPGTRLHVKGKTVLEGYTSIGDQAFRQIDFSANRINSYYQGKFEDLKLNANASTSNTLINYDGSGCVGIGTDDPHAKLHVGGSAIITDTLSVVDRIIANKLDVSEFSVDNVIANSAIINGRITHNGDLFSTKKIVVNQADNNPYYGLVVKGRTKITKEAYVYGSSYLGVNDETCVVVGGNAPKNSKFYVNGSSIFDGKTSVGELEGFHLDFFENKITSYAGSLFWDLKINADSSSSNTLINPDGTGRVGVGVEVPAAKLHVRGDTKLEGDVYNTGILRTTEVIIEVEDENTWPDYVFEKEYNLLDLYEVEKHIEEQGHLPSVPSAKVVEEDGVSVGEMNKLLLQKVEELTLYMIELKKQNDKLAEEVEALKTNR